MLFTITSIFLLIRVDVLIVVFIVFYWSTAFVLTWKVKELRSGKNRGIFVDAPENMTYHPSV